MNTSVLIVTYGDRGYLAKKVLLECVRQGASRIVIVDNALSSASKRLLEGVAKEYENVFLITNHGDHSAASGFKFGLSECILACETDFIWILDDDNLPEEGALNAIQEAYLSLQRLFPSLALYSYRGSNRENDAIAVRSGKIKRIIPNSYCGVHLTEILRPYQQKDKDRVNFPIVRTELGPYGGMFVHKEILQKFGLPDTDFYLYGDDHELTSRFHAGGVDQFLVYCSRISDIDMSAQQANGIWSSSASDSKVYYSIRNHVYLGKLHRKNRLVFFINSLLFWGLIFQGYIRALFSRETKRPSRISIIVRAARDGMAERLGRRDV